MSVRLRGACSLWAPEIAVVPVEEGGGFMVLFSVTDARRNCPINFKAAHCPPSLGLITSSPVQPSPAHSVPVQTRPDQTSSPSPAQPQPGSVYPNRTEPIPRLTTCAWLTSCTVPTTCTLPTPSSYLAFRLRHTEHGKYAVPTWSHSLDLADCSPP